MSRPPKLKAGGTLGLDDLYIHRQGDDEAFNYLVDGEYCNILTSRQMGKSSLMVRLMARLEERGVKTASVEVAGELGTAENADAWYTALLQSICDQLELPVNVGEWWSKSAAATPNQRLLTFFRDVAKVSTDAPVVVFIDEVDATLKLNYSDDFFTALRSMHNLRTTVPEYRGLTFCLLGCASPAELIKNPRTTPYNIGRSVELHDFGSHGADLEPIHNAMSSLGLPGKEILGKVLLWTDGHPFLTIAFCAMAAERGVQAGSEVDRLVEEVLPSPSTSRRLFDRRGGGDVGRVSTAPMGGVSFALKVHFDWLSNFLQGDRMRNKQDAFRLYDKILRGAKIPDDPSAKKLDLRLSGLVKRDTRGYLIVRNRIYARRFDRTWLAQTRPMRLYTKRVWFISSGIAVILVPLIVFFLFQADSYYKSRRRLTEAHALLKDLVSTRSEDEALRIKNRLCVLMGEDKKVRKLNAKASFAWTTFWNQRADAIEERAKASAEAGDVEGGLIRGALAGLKRGGLSSFMVNLYRKSADPRLVATLRGHKVSVNRVRFLNDSRIVSMGADQTVRVFDFANGKILHESAVEGLAAIDTCPGASCIVSVSTPLHVDLWTTSLSRYASYDLPRDRGDTAARGIHSVSLGPQQNGIGLIGISGEDGLALFGRIAFPSDESKSSRRVLDDVSLLPHLNSVMVPPVYAIRFTNDGRRIVTAAHDLRVRIFDTATKTEIDNIRLNSQIFDVRMSPVGSDYRAVFGTETESVVYDLNSRRPARQYRNAILFISASFSNNGKWVVNAASTRDERRGVVVVWGADSGEELFRVETTSRVRDAEFDLNPEPEYVASAHEITDSEDGCVRVWRLSKAKKEEEFDRNVHSMWLSWQLKFGYTVEDKEGGRVIPLDPQGPKDAIGYSSDICSKDH